MGFRVASGSSSSAFSAVSFSLGVGVGFGRPPWRWFRAPLIWRAAFCVFGDFVCPNCRFVFAVGIGFSLLALVLVVLFMRWFRCVCSYVRLPLLERPVIIFPKSGKFAKEAGRV